MQAEVWSEKQVKSANKQIENFYFLFYLPCDLIGGVWFCVTMVYFFVTGMDYVRGGEIQRNSFVFLTAHYPCILPCLT